jgi:hypothetical protein
MVLPPARPPRAVLDTSVLVPPALRRAFQQAAANGDFVALWSPWIIAELNRVLTWLWIKRPQPGNLRGDLSDANEQRCSEAAKRMMTLLLPVFEIVAPAPPYPPPWPELTDQWDQPILAAAILGGADFVVSDNTRHYPPRQADGRHVYQGVEYVGGRNFLDMFVLGRS